MSKTTFTAAEALKGLVKLGDANLLNLKPNKKESKQMSNFNFKSGQEVFVICGNATIRTTLDGDMQPVAGITMSNYDMIPVPKTTQEIIEVAEYLNNKKPKKKIKKK